MENLINEKSNLQELCRDELKEIEGGSIFAFLLLGAAIGYVIYHIKN
jgi:hypothetical protein